MLKHECLKQTMYTYKIKCIAFVKHAITYESHKKHALEYK